ncbi:nucleoside recognition domain-containing protein [Anaerovorax odorimutans]|uniref:nucleoside recognition domain-containing protein n=1 Tax=Anaerovorax odorimutans TaxID=109327 RepID=UPI002ED195D5
MCMGFGCNACGVIGCRIIESPRERLIAILTNSFVPCNGRFPTLIAVITMFFVASLSFGSGLGACLILTVVIVLGVTMTLLMSKLLSKTVLKGMPSSFILELPPYRRPKIGSVIVRSILDRTIFVLGRAIVVAAPAGLLIWVLANVDVGGVSILTHCTDFCDPFGRLLGIDGVIVMAFILGFPANEIVIPIILMTYMAQGSLMDYDSLAQLHQILIENGWTWQTALSTMLLCLFHFPCGTTCLTIKKETGSWKWTGAAFLLPTLVGIILCLLLNGILGIIF